MKRRRFFKFASLAGLASLGGASGLSLAKDGDATGADALPSGDGVDGIDPYFLHPGEYSDAEKNAVMANEEYLDVTSRGGEAPKPRGRKPRWAPTYRLLHWAGELGQEGVELTGPLAVEPQMPEGRAYRLNAQIIDFHTANKRWGRGSEGALSVEFRARQSGEALTWLFAEQFRCFGESTSLGSSYVAERNGSPEPVVLDEANIDVRVQLMRLRKAPGILRKILNIASFIVTGGATGVISELIPSVRVPMLVQEGVALTQALFGEMSEDKPQWLSGFNSYGLNEAGSRLSLAPGFWIVLDEVVDFDLRDARLVDVGDRAVITVNDKPIDATYLVFWVEIESGSNRRNADIIEKGAPRQVESD